MRDTSFLRGLRFAGLYTGLLTIVLLLTACGTHSMGALPITTGTTTPTSSIAPTPTANPTPAPTPVLGVQPCPPAVSSTNYWDTILQTQASTSKVESVTCAKVIGNTSLQALVNVRSTGSVLDAYIYDAISNPAPHQVFKLLQLYKGAARISPYGTLITAEVDQNSSVNKQAGGNAALQQDLFREFKWSDGAGTLVPVAFPGIFPDLTRYQAEVDQRQVDQGQQPWKRDAKMTANALAATMLKWSSNAPASITHGGGVRDINATVTVKSTHPGSGSIEITLSRLEGKVSTGIWIVSNVSTKNLTITAPPSGARLSSPTTVQGTGQAFEGVVGTVRILDHTYSDIGHASVRGKDGMGDTTFSTNVNYTSSFKTGTQEGIIAIYARSNADGSIASAAMVKVLL